MQKSVRESYWSNRVFKVCLQNLWDGIETMAALMIIK